VIAQSLTTDSLLLDEYTQKVKNEIIADFKFASYIAKFFYNLSFFTYNLVRKTNKFSEAFVRVVVGEKSYSDMFKYIRF